MPPGNTTEGGGQNDGPSPARHSAPERNPPITGSTSLQNRAAQDSTNIQMLLTAVNCLSRYQPLYPDISSDFDFLDRPFAFPINFVTTSDRLNLRGKLQRASQGWRKLVGSTMVGLTAMLEIQMEAEGIQVIGVRINDGINLSEEERVEYFERCQKVAEEMDRFLQGVKGKMTGVLIEQ